MTITINLPDETLAALRADAGAQGRSAEQVAAEHLAALYVDEDDERTAVEEALAELEAGQGRPFAEFSEEFPARQAAARLEQLLAEVTEENRHQEWQTGSVVGREAL